MDVQLIAVPYDSALRGWRMGAGPGRLLERGLAEDLRRAGHRVEVEWVEADPGVVWLDAHGDFNTPETTTGGFLDGMALATVVGRCWARLAAAVPGFRPVPEERVILAGCRDLDPPEAELLARSDVVLLPPERARPGLDGALRALRSRTPDVYLHLDLDVLDPEVGRANGLAAPGGPGLEELRTMLESVASTLRVRAVALTAYDPEHDPQGRICDAASAVLRAVLAVPRAASAP
jgi:arginase